MTRSDGNWQKCKDLSSHAGLNYRTKSVYDNGNGMRDASNIIQRKSFEREKLDCAICFWNYILTELYFIKNIDKYFFKDKI